MDTRRATEGPAGVLDRMPRSLTARNAVDSSVSATPVITGEKCGSGQCREIAMKKGRNEELAFAGIIAARSSP